MRIALRTVDGREYLSDAYKENELREIADTDEEVHDKITELLREFDNLTYLSIQIDGRMRFFNPRNIIWGEVVD